MVTLSLGAPSVYAAASILGGVDSTRCLEDSTREILAHIDTASSLAADLTLRIHDANLPVQEIERCSIEVRPHNWGGIHCWCSGFEVIQALRDDMLSRLVQETGKAAPTGERLPFKTPHSLKFIMQLLLLYLKLECRPIPAHLMKYQKGDRRYRCEVQ